MLPRISRPALAALLVAGFFGADSVQALQAQHMESPLQLTSLEWLVADSDVIVRGIVADVALDRNWNIVTIDVLENLKGAECKRLSFVAHSFDAGNAVLAEAKKSKREQVWILKHHSFSGPSEAPDREKTLARHKTELYAPFVAGRPREPALPVVPLGKLDIDAKTPPLAFLTIDLCLVKTSDEIVAAIRTAIAATPRAESGGSVRSYSVGLPQEIAERTGFSRAQNQIVVPVDGRLEDFARRLLRNPSQFLARIRDAAIRKSRIRDSGRAPIPAPGSSQGSTAFPLGAKPGDRPRLARRSDDDSVVRRRRERAAGQARPLRSARSANRQ